MTLSIVAGIVASGAPLLVLSMARASRSDRRRGLETARGTRRNSRSTQPAQRSRRRLRRLPGSVRPAHFSSAPIDSLCARHGNRVHDGGCDRPGPLGGCVEHSMNRGIHLATLAAATLLLVACSGSSENTESSTSAIDPSTTAAAVTTTLPADPTIPSTPPSETASTVVPSPPTTDPTSTWVIEGLIASRDAYLYAVYNPHAVDALDRLNSTHAADGPSLALVLRQRPDTDRQRVARTP